MILLTAGETYQRMFGLDWQLLADATLTLIAVFTLTLVASYFLLNPAKKFLQSRTDRIKGELDDAANKNEEASKLKEEYEAKLKGADKEIENILGDARSRALANETKIVADAKEEAARIINQAKVEAQLEKNKMADEVKKEMIVVASAMTAKLVSASIDAKVQEQLIEETLKEIGDSTWQS